MLRGVILEDVGSPANLDANLFAPALLLTRVQRLGANLCGANPSVNVGSGLSIGLSMAGSIAQLTLGVNGRVPLTSGDVVVSVEADSRWIKDQPAAGIALGLLETAGALAFKPSLAANGLGLRISKTSGPLVNAGLSLGSVAIHLFGKVGDGIETAGGVQVQLSDLAVAVSGAQGGNPVARGLTGDSGSGSNGLAPAFSPALAVQKHGGGPVLVSLRAGDGDGPWWLVIQKGFGPIYIEQVGFGVTVREDQLERISILLDGRVSLFGLTAAVDDLSLTYVVASDASLFDPSAVGRRSGRPRRRCRPGRRHARRRTAQVRLRRQRRVRRHAARALRRLRALRLRRLRQRGGERPALLRFFAFGAVNGPDRRPAGLLPHRHRRRPRHQPRPDLPDRPVALRRVPVHQGARPGRPTRPRPDGGAGPPARLLPDEARRLLVRRRHQLHQLRARRRHRRGLGVDRRRPRDRLLGLARMALPRPQVALVSIELALLVRFSTKEGVIWVQAQLTDNSWLLHESVRLTGGFAFVVWFKGRNAGQFVLTMGGYHPRFHRDGYPEVPRLGFHWPSATRSSSRATPTSRSPPKR